MEVFTFIGESLSKLWTMLMTTDTPFGFTYGQFFIAMLILGILIDWLLNLFYDTKTVQK